MASALAPVYEPRIPTMPDDTKNGPPVHRHITVSDFAQLDATDTVTVKRETWADWWPGHETDPDQLLTRQELADRAATEGIAVSAQEISNWQRAGILPR